MDRFDTVIAWGLATVGILAILIGIGTIIYATTVINPRLEELTDRGLEGLELAERGLDLLNTHSEVMAPLNPPQSNTLATMRDLPTALEQGGNVSEHAAETLARSATTLREIENDLGIILPGNALRENAEAFATSAESLRGLSPVLYRMHEQTDTLVADLTRASKEANRFQKELKKAGVTLEQVRAQVSQTQNTLHSSNLPVEVTRMITLGGGLFIVLGILLLGMAGIWRRLGRIAE